MSAADIDKGTVEAAEWAGELFGAYAQHGGDALCPPGLFPFTLVVAEEGTVNFNLGA